jgi:hypothetical protein
MADDPVNDNANEIARVRNKRNRAQVIFFSCLALIPLSCLGGCGLAMLIPHETARAVFAGIGLLAPFLGLGGMLLMLGDRSRYGRSLDLALLGDELGLAYTEQPTRRQLREVRQFQVFREPTDDYSRNGLEGEFKKTPVVIMDYNCSWGRGRLAYVIAQTVLVFPEALPEAPDLILFPKGLLDKLADAVGLGGRPVRIPGEKQLNKAYGLFSEEEAAALFTADVAEICLEERKLVLEVSGGSLLVYWAETYIKPGELPDRLATAVKLKRLLSGK